MRAATRRDTPSCPASDSLVIGLSAMASVSSLLHGRSAARGFRCLGLLGVLEGAREAEGHDVVALLARDEIHHREPAAALKSGDEIRDRAQAVALPREDEPSGRLVEAVQPDEIGQGLRDLVEHVHGALLLGLQLLDEGHLALEQGLLLLDRDHLDLDRLEVALPLLVGPDRGVELPELGRLQPPQGGAEEESAAREQREQEVRLEGPRSRGDAGRGFLLLFRRALRRQKVDANHRSPTLRTARPTAIAADGAISLMKSGSKSFGL